MIDINDIRERREDYRRIIQERGKTLDIDELLNIDEQRRTSQQRVEELRRQQHEASDSIASAKGEEKAKRIAQMQSVAAELKVKEAELRSITERYDALMAQVPNIHASDTPIDPTGEGNVEIRRVGEPPKFKFPPKDHMALGKLHKMIDTERGVKVAGARGYFLTGIGAELHWAVLRMAQDIAKEKGFTLMEPPVLTEEAFLYGTGHFPAQRDEVFEVHDKDRVQFLVGTSEVPLMGYHANETLEEDELPVRLAACSPCFRTEVGSYGKDTKGLYRVRQFSKVEQLILCKNDEEASQAHFKELIENAEAILTALELPYRLLRICSGDMGQGKVEEWDIETWMPSRDAYGETHTCSRLHEFQARRLKIKYRTKDGEKRFVHTLNNTIVASPRILIALLENHQQEDGSIRVPKALVPYLNGRTVI